MKYILKILIVSVGVMISLSSIQLATAGEVELTIAGPEFELIRIGAGIMNIRYRAEFTNVLDNIHAEGTVSLSGSHGKKICAVNRHIGKYSAIDGCLKFSLPDVGYYDVAVKLFAGDTVVASANTTCAAIPDNSNILMRDFGVCTHLRKVKGFYSRYLDLIRMAGFSRIRDDFTWGIVEKEKGVYNVPDYYGEYLASAVSRGLKPLLILDYGNKHYKGAKRGFPKGDESRRAFVEYARMAVSSYGCYVKHWELYNEPNGVDPVDEYLPLLKLVYPAIHELQPDAEVISCGGGGAGGGAGGSYIDPILKAGGVDFQDGISIHPYMAPHDPDLGYPATGEPLFDVNISTVWSLYKKIIESSPRRDKSLLNLWVTEIGWSSGEGKRQVKENLQAAYLLRTFLQSRKQETAKALFWYDFLNDGYDSGEMEQNFGIIRRDFSPKPSYVAAAVLSNTLANRKFTGVIRDDDIRLYRYGNGHEQVIAGWSVKGDKEIKISLAAGTYKVRDWQGSETPLLLDRNMATVTLANMPVYVIQK